MTELLMTTWDGAGTTPPMMSVARALVARGHRLRVLADPVLRADVEATGAEFVSWTRAPHRRRRGYGDHFVQDWCADPAEGFGRMRDALALGPAAAYAADVREELERRPAAALLTELLLFGPQVAAEAAGIPYVVLNTTVNVVPAPGVPPFGLGLMPATDEEGGRRDEEMGAAMLAAWDAGLPALNAARAENGLEPLEHALDQGRTAARVLVMTSRAFDFLGPLPPTVVHVGPRLDDIFWSGEWESPPGEEPLVLVGLSSDYQDQGDLLQRIAAALGLLPVRAVLTTGNGIDPGTIEAPSNVQVLKSAPHSVVLREAALAVTHAGHGVTIKSLAAGVPLVCLPMGRDQLDIAARVVHAGAGLRLEPTAAPAEIASAVEQVLGNASYGEAAERIATTIAEETASDRAVEEIEAVLASTPSRDAVTA
jgi:UDP:flavonoid glycosyltransferase YjiC (YdhE family)